MYRPENFIVQEFVPPSVYDVWGDRSWWFIDENLVADLQTIRDHFGSLVVNNWKWGGEFEQRGLRTSEWYGADVDKWNSYMSQHKFGKAFDFHSKSADAEEIRNWIFDNPTKFQAICGVEIDVPWVHIDSRNAKPNFKDSFYVFGV